MKKVFWGYNSEDEAKQFWSEETLYSGEKTEKTINVVDDPTVYPQTSSKQVKVVRCELENDIISYAVTS